jgi:hypothetical protein
LAKPRKYACVKCGTLLEVHPPDAIHKYASRNEALCERSVKVEQVCEKCGHANTIYWCNFIIPEWYA